MSRQMGLKDIHIAILKTDDATATTYDAPIKLEIAISAKLSPKSNSDNIYSDDVVEDVITAFEGVDVEREVNQLSLASRAKLQGARVIKGVLVENKDDIPPTLSLGFKSKKNKGKYKYVWLFKGKFELVTGEYDTEGENLKAQSAKLKGKVFSRDFDGNYRFICDEDAEGVEATTISEWCTNALIEPA